MSEVKMKALQRHAFGTGAREAGEEYLATDSEAKVLVALGWAVRADAAAKPVAKPAAKPAAKVAAKQTYRTRDLKAKR